MMTPLAAVERVAREDGHLFDTRAPNGGNYCMFYSDRCDEGAPEGMAAHGPGCGPEHDWGCDCGWAEAIRVLRDLAEEAERE